MQHILYFSTSIYFSLLFQSFFSFSPFLLFKILHKRSKPTSHLFQPALASHMQSRWSHKHFRFYFLEYSKAEILKYFSFKPQIQDTTYRIHVTLESQIKFTLRSLENVEPQRNQNKFENKKQAISHSFINILSYVKKRDQQQNQEINWMKLILVYIFSPI